MNRRRTKNNVALTTPTYPDDFEPAVSIHQPLTRSWWEKPEILSDDDGMALADHGWKFASKAS
jgi:hypothetical protein